MSYDPVILLINGIFQSPSNSQKTFRVLVDRLFIIRSDILYFHHNNRRLETLHSQQVRVNSGCFTRTCNEIYTFAVSVRSFTEFYTFTVILHQII